MWSLAVALAVAAAGGVAPEPQAAAQTGGHGTPLSNVQLGVTFEGYYQYNGNRPYDRVNLLRAYDTRANVFSIQQAAVVIESAPDVAAGRRLGARLDLQFGQATETVQGGPANEPRPDVMRHIWQAYGTYVFPLGRGLQADFGKFASNLGFETNYAKDNSQFSRAYLFNFLPFYHSGVRLTLPVSDKVTLMYMLTNGIQQTEDFNDFKSNHVTAIVKPNSKVAWTVNYFFGQEQPDGGRTDRPGRLLPRLRHLRDVRRDVRRQLRAGRELRDQRGEQGRSVARAQGHRRLRALPGVRHVGAVAALRASR